MGWFSTVVRGRGDEARAESRLRRQKRIEEKTASDRESRSRYEAETRRLDEEQRRERERLRREEEQLRREQEREQERWRREEQRH